MVPTVVPSQPAGIQLVPTVVSTQPPCMPVAFPFQGMSSEMQTSLFQHFMAMQTMQAATRSSGQPAKPTTPTPVQPESSGVQPTVLQVQTVEPVMTLLSRGDNRHLRADHNQSSLPGRPQLFSNHRAIQPRLYRPMAARAAPWEKARKLRAPDGLGWFPLNSQLFHMAVSTFIPPSHGPRAQAPTMLTLDDIDTRNNIAPANVINQHKIV
jgi:hypothetical protein